MKQSPPLYFVARGETTKMNDHARQTLRGKYVRLSLGITHYELTGPENGALVLLFPGMTIPLFYWDEFIPHLHSSGYRTLAYSAYGRGFSDRPEAIYDMDLFVNQSIELLQALHLKEPTHVIGTSLGALMAMELLNRKVFAVKTLTIIGPAGLDSSDPAAARIAKNNFIGKLFGTYLGHKSVLKHLRHNVLAETSQRKLLEIVGNTFIYEGSVYAVLATLRSFPMINRQAVYKTTAQLQIPTLVMWGQEDNVTPIKLLPEVLELVQPREHHVIKNCGHMAAFECPEKVAEKFILFSSQYTINKKSIRYD